MSIGGSLESVSRRFGHPIALSCSPDVVFRAISTQGHDGALDVVEVSYLVHDEPQARVQPSVWTWLAGPITEEDALAIHAVTHHLSHLSHVRSGARVPDSAETDRLQRELRAVPRELSRRHVGDASVTATRFDFGSSSYGSLAVEGLFVTVAGPPSVVDSPIELRVA